MIEEIKQYLLSNDKDRHHITDDWWEYDYTWYDIIDLYWFTYYREHCSDDETPCIKCPVKLEVNWRKLNVYIVSSINFRWTIEEFDEQMMWFKKTQEDIQSTVDMLRIYNVNLYEW